MAELTITDLYKLFEDNQLSPNNTFEPINQPKQNNSFIKTGDIVVAQIKDREYKGEIERIFEKSGIEFFDLKISTNGISSIVPIGLDNIIEHYPKNRKFDQQTTKKEIVQEKKVADLPKTQVKTVETPKPITITPTLVEENKNDKKKTETQEEEPEKTMRTAEEVEEEENKKNPENTNFNETVKVIGKITHFSSKLTLNEVIDFLAKRGIDKEKCWYFITEKNGELHLIRNNDLGFKIQPFVLSFIDLKIKDKLTESKEQIKIVGNNQFSIVSNIPKELYETVKNGLIALLSQTKK
jgi:glutamyl/glutaminyl-tRNA synthetase